MKRAAALVALIASLAAFSAADARRAAEPAEAQQPSAQRIVIDITVFGDDKCPQAVSDEIVVCARKPESERYRIPKDLRHQVEIAGPQSWTSRVATVVAEDRKVLPGSCSPIGSYGQSGCAQAALDRWFAERRQQQ